MRSNDCEPFSTLETRGQLLDRERETRKKRERDASTATDWLTPRRRHHRALFLSLLLLSFSSIFLSFLVSLHWRAFASSLAHWNLPYIGATLPAFRRAPFFPSVRTYVSTYATRTRTRTRAVGLYLLTDRPTERTTDRPTDRRS